MCWIDDCSSGSWWKLLQDLTFILFCEARIVLMIITDRTLVQVIIAKQVGYWATLRMSLTKERISFIHPEIIGGILEPAAFLIENPWVSKGLGSVQLIMMRFNGHCLPCWVICVRSIAHIMGIIMHITFDLIFSTILEILRVNTMWTWGHIGHGMILLMYILIRLLVS